MVAIAVAVACVFATADRFELDFVLFFDAWNPMWSIWGGFWTSFGNALANFWRLELLLGWSLEILGIVWRQMLIFGRSLVALGSILMHLIVSLSFGEAFGRQIVSRISRNTIVVTFCRIYVEDEKHDTTNLLENWDPALPPAGSQL